MGCDLTDYIALWEAEKSPVATTYLAELVIHRAEHLASGTLPWIWWQNDAQRTVPRWLPLHQAKRRQAADRSRPALTPGRLAACPPIPMCVMSLYDYSTIEEHNMPQS